MGMNQIKVELQEWMGSDVSIANAAWTSTYDKDKREGKYEDSDKVAKLVERLILDGHGTPIESVVFRFWIQMPVFTDRQHMTHRVACLTGNTRLWFDLPNAIKKNKRSVFKMSIDEFYQKWNEGVKSPIWNKIVFKNHKNRLSSMNLRSVEESSGRLVHTKIKNIWSTGVQPVYEFEFENNYKIQMTLNHKIFSNRGWVTMGEILNLKSGEVPNIIPQDVEFHANGEPAYKNKNYVKSLREKNFSVQEMADDMGISYHTVRKWLKIHGLSFSKEETYFKKGAATWNKGKNYSFVKPYVHTEKRKAFYETLKGEKSNFWRGGVCGEQAKIRKECTPAMKREILKRDNYTCQKCFINCDLEVHHIIPIWKDPERVAEKDNLITLCKKCHKKEHGFVPKEILDKRTTTKKIVTRLVKLKNVNFIGNKPTFDLEVLGPDHNFIADGMCVHNSHNGLSGRYRTMPEDCYTLPTDVCDIFAKMGQPGDVIYRDYNEACREAIASYRRAVASLKESEKAGFITNSEFKRVREVVRGQLPVSNMTERTTVINLRSFANYMKQRLSSHAQPEIQEVARQMLAAVEAANVCPVAIATLKKNGWHV